MSKNIIIIKKLYSSILYDFFYFRIFYAGLDREMIVTSIILTSNENMNYPLSGFIKDYQHLLLQIFYFMKLTGGEMKTVAKHSISAGE